MGGQEVNLFKEVVDRYAIVLQRGVYYQVPIYTLGTRMFVKHGGGFVRLAPSGATSKPNMTWLQIEGEYYDDPRNFALSIVRV